MEILELLLAAFDVCGCLLEIAAVGFDLGAWTSGRSYYKARKRSRADAEAPPPDRRWFVLMLVLGGIGVMLTAVTVAKWTMR